ncbi:NfeD family protein [Prochlorothrix hollandica]|uniref:NfeD-like protein n=1 Tax=Prochlorothrix hollandica PCC 9006 = CALU 1027 TaxID=317619 RepID=A0A0M2Q199_PROHO|nr:NfeD family protein [Prochlorothrix hollandica]KKJ00739.1 hypothetical protein PROH_05565 [Prochlorothrix hollandica PCC 9006 = CALU 1027]
MTTLYVFPLIIGGIFVALAAVGGLDGADFDTDFDVDISGQESDSNPPTALTTILDRLGQILPLLNLRFWTFTAFIFGLSGFLLTLVHQNLSETDILIISTLLGVVFGSFSVNLMRWLRSEDADSLVRSEDFVGAQGVVEIPFDPNSRGKIKLELRGTHIYLQAMTSEDKTFGVGDNVLVVGLEGSRAWVVSEENIENH